MYDRIPYLENPFPMRTLCARNSYGDKDKCYCLTVFADQSFLTLRSTHQVYSFL